MLVVAAAARGRGDSVKRRDCVALLADKVRAGHQSQDGHDARPEDPAVGAVAR